MENILKVNMSRANKAECNSKLESAHLSSYGNKSNYGMEPLSYVPDFEIILRLPEL